jgi:hypothetical protein
MSLLRAHGLHPRSLRYDIPALPCSMSACRRELCANFRHSPEGVPSGGLGQISIGDPQVSPPSATLGQPSGLTVFTILVRSTSLNHLQTLLPNFSFHGIYNPDLAALAMPGQEKPSCHGMETSAALVDTRRASHPFTFAFPASFKKASRKESFVKDWRVLRCSIPRDEQLQAALNGFRCHTNSTGESTC